ncbi:hypothetical protein [Methanosarcina virus MetMV]|nr:hypothetical protein [Methanosarcina virus MetMV]
MKTDCEKYDECRKPVQACTPKCLEYVKRKNSSARKQKRLEKRRQ